MLPVEFFAERLAVMKIKSRVISAIPTLAALSTQIGNRVFFALNPTQHLALAKAFLAIRLSSFHSFAVKVRERQLLLALAADFIHAV